MVWFLVKLLGSHSWTNWLGVCGDEKCLLRSYSIFLSVTMWSRLFFVRFITLGLSESRDIWDGKPFISVLWPISFAVWSKASVAEWAILPLHVWGSSHMWDKPSSALWVVRCFFSWISRFCPTLWLTRLKMSDIILIGCTTQIKKIIKKNKALIWRICTQGLSEF